MMPAGPEDGRNPLYEVPPARVPTRGRWRAAAIGATAVVGLVATVILGVLPSRDPGGSPGLAGTATSPSAAGSQGSPGGAPPPQGSGTGPVGPSAATGGTAVPGTGLPAATPWVPGPPGRIALVTPEGSLEVVDDVTGATTPVELDGRVTLPPAWSPDGSRIAAIVAAPGTAHLEVVKPAGGATVVYASVDKAPFYLSWSPDGARVGFLAGDAAGGISLRTAMADGSKPSDGLNGDGVLRRGAPLYFAWPAADRLLLHVGTGGTAFTGVVGLGGKGDGGTLPGTGNFRAASAGLHAVAYVTGGNVPAIVVAAADGTELARMAAFGPAALAFDPGGTRLAAIASPERVGSAQAFPIGPLRLLDPATGDVRTLVNDDAFAFYWSPDGTTIAVLRLVSAGGSNSAVRGDVRLAAAGPTPSPAGQAEVHLTFVDARDGTVRSDRVVQLGDAYVQNVLPYFDQYALSHAVWSPDGRAIVLPLTDDTRRTMATVLSVDGTDPRPIAEAVYATWSR